MKRPRTILSLLVLTMFAMTLFLINAKPRPSHPYLVGTWDSLQVMAHQGGDRLWPSNTLYAFERAAQLGADVLELDVHASGEGKLVVIHDDTVDRTTNGSGPVKEKLLTDLQEFDAGYKWSPERLGGSFPYRGQGLRIPTLVEVLEAFPDYKINIEIKQLEPSITAPLCDLIRIQARETDVMVGSFHAEAMKDFRQRCPEVATSATPAEVRNFYILTRLSLARFARAPAEALQVPEYQGDLQIVSERFLGAAHRKNMQVHVWTVDELSDMERLISLGVDGIVTDRPDRLIQALGRSGEIALPAGVPE